MAAAILIDFLMFLLEMNQSIKVQPILPGNQLSECEHTDLATIYATSQFHSIANG